jgi:hypothetical protein
MRIVLSTVAAAALLASHLPGASAAPASYSAKGSSLQSNVQLVKTKAKKKTTYTAPSAKKHKMKRTSRTMSQQPPAGR